MNEKVSQHMPNVPINSRGIRDLVYTIRGQQVMLDADLADLYQVETRILNRNVARNISRFPEDFRFQLTKEELENLKSQIGISRVNEHGGRRTLPYAYTEQGISMLASVLKSDTAIRVSIAIMRTFVEMRRFIASNAVLFERIERAELRQLTYQKDTDEKFEQVFDFIHNHTESSQKMFFNGQIYDAFSLLVNLIQKATKDIILIDGYVDISTLNLLAKKKDKVYVEIYTLSNTKLTATDIATFNSQYPSIIVKHTNTFHDRFLILDHQEAYHIGASVKDAGKKCFAITLLQDIALVRELLAHL
ncbi:ORF6N domain-containing protein [Anaerovibrio sp. RM50]|uniref:ORF6N domain-containing protein n=1 Tax=Anaerovibrio sp. RM50 TaxID=1200557 RepID=UPI000485B6D9|nr:ORF6N domain-containing protein [Anaerovibrio sp. RM50]